MANKSVKKLARVSESRGNKLRLGLLNAGLGISPDWEVDDSFVPAKTGNSLEAHTVEELIECLKSDNKLQLDARVIASHSRHGQTKFMRLNRESFLERVKAGNTSARKVREAVDCFADAGFDSGGSCVGSSDFVPLVGGPFYKQLYYYDYIRMHSAAFYAYNHDPMGKRVVHTMKDFTISLDWKVEFKDQGSQAVWDAFVKVNNLYGRMDMIAQEMSTYGEVLVWWLPNNETKIGFQLKPGQEPQTGMLPRVRLIDPSVIWEIVTFPEDIERVLYYQWIAPTQFQYYDGKVADQSVGVSKFIVQQIPAAQVQHYKINSVSNEKRGRSDLFPVLGYLKRLRDSVNYSIIALQKQAAWCIDTEIDGTEEHINEYVRSQQELGTIPPAGSEFVHSDKVKRTYLGNQSMSRSGSSQAFDWCCSMIAVGTGIPLQYLGTHLSGAQTRASAVVATEPVAKLFEGRRNVYSRIIEGMVEKLFDKMGVREAPDFRIIFPELVAQDRSAKLKDLSLSETQGWISKKRAGETAAKELGFVDYNFEEERKGIEDQQSSITSPLTSPGKVPPGEDDEEKPRLSAAPTSISGQDRRALSKNRGF